MSVSGSHSPFIANTPTPIIQNNSIPQQTLDANNNNNNNNVITGDDNNNNNTFSNIIPVPIKVSRQQSNAILSNNHNQRHLQYSLNNLNVFNQIPKDNISTAGVDSLSRFKLALLSGIPEEIKWTLKKYLVYSTKAPYMISLKNLPDLLQLFKNLILDLMPIIENFNQPLINDMNDKLQIGITSLLILRNLAQDTESIQVLVADEEIKNFILFVLTKFQMISKGDPNWQLWESNSSYFNELIHYTIDLMEGISSYIAPAKKNNPFFQTLVSALNFTKDRYMVISILRSLSRLLVRSKADEESAADDLHEKSLNLIVSFLLIEKDSELIIASLDFLYQYMLPGNERISGLFDNEERYSIFTTMLPKLLTYNVKLPNYSALNETNIKLITRVRPPPPTTPPHLPENLFKQLLLLNEPMRSTAWLRCCFEPVEDAEFTQIALWRAYEAKFSQPIRESGRKLLAAVEFIKNVSNAFHDASAMVIVDQVTGKKRFVIKGIQPREKAISIKEGDIASRNTLVGLTSKFLDDPYNLTPSKQLNLPSIDFPTELSDVSKVATTFLCLVSNDTKGPGGKFCKEIKPLIFHRLVDVPPLISLLSEYMDNTPNV
ncbi:Rsc9p NDAI_0E00190 [Naumovozyma dairenensis CBS 421]|uniref:RFX-type winged-helix domain-containing protein n=1 Tax=Naumovozyma dairenensis (strain ATCC 10597 / BCRC 20456 / CBS 421 / NBRC 0211 / NRRL Y-12639) TaxID=1071378 RepID=G0WAR5_NAUDC|nr:hypothetical protein NDAI_0E00190 [Naumovozyma dairenensis CBS 421]CCD24835.1 hypothetical protein NDAI_0E00190 [Naumovozyma dairenensis CBS 421]